MFDPASELYHIEQERQAANEPVLAHCLTGFVDAGHAGRLAVDHLLEHLEHRVIATFDMDQLLDYRSRRPMITFDGDRFEGYDPPLLRLHEVTDEQGTSFLLLSGPEPDLQWERFVAAIRELIERFQVRLSIGLSAVPMTVPHTRPVTVTAHATRPELVEDYRQWFGNMQVPASAATLLEVRLGAAGHDAEGFVVHVPHYLSRAEYPESARGLLEHLASNSGLALPVEALRPAAERVLAQVREQVEQSEEVQQVVHQLEEQFDAAMEAADRSSFTAMQPDELPSADEIGAELERFLAEQGRRPPPENGPR